MESLNERIEKLSNLIETSDHIIIGAGAGLSTAAGIEYETSSRSMISQTCILQDSIPSKARRRNGPTGLVISA